MKQSTFSAVMANSIKNLLQRYTKGIRFTAILTMLFTVGVGSMLGGSIVLTYSDFGYTSTSYSSTTITKSNVSFTCDNGAKKSERLALKASASLYNTTALPGKITSIVIENVAFSSASNAGFYVYGSTTKQGTTTTLLNNTGTTGSITINFSSYNYKYFTIKNKSTRALYNTKITINYEDVVTETSIYLNPGVWNADAAKYAIYYFSGNTTGWSSLMTKVNDCEEIYTTKIPQLSNMTIIPVRLNNNATSGDWNKKWNQTENITFNSNYDFIQITNWGSSSDNCLYTYNSKYTSKTFTITFKGNNNTGGTMSQVTGITCKGSKTLPANTFTRTGYNFNGWNTNANGTGTQYAAGATISNITSDITLYAQWKIGTYTITLNANGGSGHTTSVTATYNSATLSSAITNPTRTGYAFKGWYSSSSGGSMVIDIDGKLQANVSGYTGANGVWTATSAKTLYAQWQILSYTVTWVVDVDKTLETVNHGETVAKAPDIDPNNLPCGQKFAGWTDKPITGTTDNIPAPLYKTAAEIPAIEDDITFYAVFADYVD